MLGKALLVKSFAARPRFRIPRKRWISCTFKQLEPEQNRKTLVLQVKEVKGRLINLIVETERKTNAGDLEIPTLH